MGLKKEKVSYWDVSFIITVSLVIGFGGFFLSHISGWHVWVCLGFSSILSGLMGGWIVATGGRKWD